jgi:hypothetical protein
MVSILAFLYCRGFQGDVGMLYAFVVSAFGFMFGARMMEHLIAKDLYSRSEMTKIGTAYLAVVIFLAVSLPRTRFATWIAIFLPMLVLFVGITALVKHRSVRFRDSFVEALAIVSLKMKSGRSFRQAYSEVCLESPPKIRAKLTEMGSFVVFSQQNRPIIVDQFVSEVIQEMIRIDQQPHAATKRIAVFREKLRIEDDFRRRSGQVLSRIRAQSMIMTGLYLALAVFMAWKFGYSGNQHTFFFSGAFFVTGTIWMWRGGRKMKWKV